VWKTLRVVHVTPGITEAGIGVHVRELAKALSKRGVETKIYTVGSIERGKICIPSTPDGRRINEGIEVNEFFGINPPEFGGILPELFNPFPHPDFFRRLSKEEGVIHIHGNEYFITIAASSIAKLTKKPYVLTIHNVGKAFSDDPLIKPLRAILNSSLFNMAIRQANAVIAPTDEAVRYLKRFRPRRVERIRLAIDLKRFEGNCEHNSRYILYLGRLDPVKEVDLLIEAAELVLQQVDVDFVIAGDGVEKIKLESLVKQKGLSEKFNFLGKMAYADVPNVFLGALAFYAGRAAGYTLLESAAAKKPIICVRDEWSLDAIGGEGNALFVPKDSKHLAEAIISVIKDQKLRSSLIENAYRFVKEHASWGRVVDDYMKVYQSL